MTPRFYKLLPRFSRRDGYVEGEIPEYDIWMTQCPEKNKCNPEDWESPSSFFKPQELNIPAGIEFMGMWDFLQINDPTFKRVTDYPEVKEGWPIMSKRMLSTLLSVRPFPHQVIPITIESDERGSEDTTDEFIAVQLTEHLENVFDSDSSIYKNLEYVFEGTQRISRTLKVMALKEPDGGFPPLFRVKEKPVCLYVSSEARLALENAGIQEIRFSTYKLASV